MEGKVRDRCLTSVRRGLLLFVSSLLFLTCLGFYACRQSPDDAPDTTADDTVAANADLVIALLPERNVFEQKVKYLPLQKYLTEELEITVYFKLLDNYEHIFAALLDGQVHGGFWGSMNGAIAQVRGGVEILARPVWEDNSSTYWGHIFVLEDSGIGPDPQSWEGHSIAFVNKATTAGFLYPISLLRGAGIASNPGDYFSKAIFSGSHDAAIIAVLQGDVEIGACKNTIYEEFMSRNPEMPSLFRILATSPEVPSNGLGVSPNLDGDIKRRLKEALINMHLDPQGQKALADFGALRFIETSFEDYSPVLEMAEKAGIDLSEWPLRDVRDARPYR